MRLHTLRLQAFGPFATPQVIDFDRLASSGLFLLEGPTGAGKSTILDAITYALYGRLSVTSGDDDRLHSDFAGANVEPAVELEFSIGGTRYRVRRTPEYERPKHRGEGTTTAATTVHLQRLDHESWTSLSGKSHEVAGLVIDIVGLDADQFRQVALLPQGEFARFLHAKDDERGALLTRLFGADVYAAITGRLQDLARAATKSLGVAEEKIMAANAAALEAAGYDSDAREEIAALSLADRDLKFVDIDQRLRAAVLDATNRHETASAATERARADHQSAETRVARMSKLIDLRAAQEAHEATRAEHAARADRLALARRALPVSSLIEALDTAGNRVEETRTHLREIESHPTEEMLDGIGATESATRAAVLTSEGDRLQHLVESERGLPHAETTHQVLVGASQEASKEVKELQAELEQLPILREGLEARRDALAKQVADVPSADVQLAATEQQLEAARELVALTSEVEAAENASGTAKEVHLAAIDAHQRLFQSRLDGMRAELASLLVEGRECPVCGSLDHPQPALAAGPIVTAADVAVAKDVRDASEERLSATRAELVALLERKAVARALAGEHSVDELSVSQKELTLVVAEAAKAEASLNQLTGELSTLAAREANVASNLLEATTKASVAAEQVTSSAGSLERMSSDLRTAAGDYESVAAYQESLIGRARSANTLTAALLAVQGAIKAAAGAHTQALDAARSSGFESLETAQSACVDSVEMTSLEEQIQAWITAETQLQTALDDPDLVGLDPAEADDLVVVLEKVRIDLDKAQEEERTAQSGLATATQNASRFAARIGEVRKAVSDHEQLRESHATVIRLDRLARGMEGNRRIELKAYVLRLWFEQVVTAANIRLATMSSGRYELLRVDESSGRVNTRTGLTLMIVDRHTGKSRSPQSLSGGETFFTSLSLALGLADVVKAEAGGVDLDTLFIDEGFGTLDAETLDHVMAVIDELRDRGRVVGIVSHVAELKDRVPERLEVRRNKDGSSSVSVVA